MEAALDLSYDITDDDDDLINGTIFGNKVTEHKMCLFSLQILFETFLIRRRIKQDTVINVKSLHVRHLLFLSDFSDTRSFSTDFLRKRSDIKFHRNPSSGSRFVPCGRTLGQTDMTKLILAFRNFANAPKKVLRLQAK